LKRKPPSGRSAPAVAQASLGQALDASPFRPLGPAGAAPLLEKARTGGRTGVLEVIGEGGTKAAIMVREGCVVEATSGSVRGREAVLRIFLWPSGQYRWLEEDVEEATPPELETSALVTEGLRRRAVWQLMLRELPPLSARYEVDFGRLAPRLDELPAVARDLCRLFDGRRSLADVFADASMPELEAASIVGHLLAAGIIQPGEPGDVLVAPLPGAPARPNLEAPASERHRVAADGEPNEPRFPAATEQTEQTALVPVGHPDRSVGPWRLATAGVALGVAAAFMFSLGRGPSPSSHTLLAPVNVRSASTPEPPRSSVADSPPPIEQPAVPSAPPQRLPGAIPPTPARDQDLCLRARNQEVSRRVVAACERALPLASAGARAAVLGVLARAALEQGRFGRAGELARQALALDPGLAEAYAYLGFAEAEAGRREAALAAYRQYLALAPHGRLAHDIQAIVSR
jgi:hypothetical protein